MEEGSSADIRTSPGDPFLCSGQALLIGKVAVEARQVGQRLLAAEPLQRIRRPILRSGKRATVHGMRMREKNRDVLAAHADRPRPRLGCIALQPGSLQQPLPPTKKNIRGTRGNLVHSHRSALPATPMTRAGEHRGGVALNPTREKNTWNWS